MCPADRLGRIDFVFLEARLSGSITAVLSRSLFGDQLLPLGLFKLVLGGSCRTFGMAGFEFNSPGIVGISLLSH